MRHKTCVTAPRAACRGEEGYFRIKRGNNEGGIENQVTGSPTGAEWSKAK